jgi:hypothetical protein
MRILSLSAILLLLSTIAGNAFDKKNLDEAIEMAELSKNMNGDGSESMGLPQFVDGYKRWKLLWEGKDESTGKEKGWGFNKFCNRWAIFQSTEPGEQHTYAIVLRGTIDSPLSIVQDALVATTNANRVWFKDNTHNDKGHLLQLAEDANAGVHMGFASGLVDILFHKGGLGLLERLQSLDDGSVIYITGHSQGAALATLLHAFLLNRSAQINEPYKLAKKKFQIHSYGFAQPKPGDWNFAMDFSRGLLVQGGDAYVINNTWDWVPQSPLTYEWPSEFTGRLLDSYSASDKPAIQQALVLARGYADFQKMVRAALYEALRSNTANIRSKGEILAKLPGKVSEYSAKALAASIVGGDIPSPVTMLDVVFRDPSKIGVTNDLGDFNGDLDKDKYLTPAPESAPVERPTQGVGLNYAPVGMLVALPLDPAKAPARDDDLTLQHHMALYLSSLRSVKLQRD